MWAIRVFDILLVAGLLVLAWRVVMVASVFRSVVLFITFGLLMSLAWVRLEAPDIALAEAGVGAGLTGVLMLDAIGKLRISAGGSDEKEEDGAG
jgi:energy-converting hydrogenase B subunit D